MVTSLRISLTNLPCICSSFFCTSTDLRLSFHSEWQATWALWGCRGWSVPRISYNEAAVAGLCLHVKAFPSYGSRMPRQEQQDLRPPSWVAINVKWKSTIVLCKWHSTLSKTRNCWNCRKSWLQHKYVMGGSHSYLRYIFNINSSQRSRKPWWHVVQTFCGLGHARLFHLIYCWRSLCSRTGCRRFWKGPQAT